MLINALAVMLIGLLTLALAVIGAGTVGLKTKFGDWINRRIEEYRLTQPLDFIMLRNEYNDITNLDLSLNGEDDVCFHWFTKEQGDYCVCVMCGSIIK